MSVATIEAERTLPYSARDLCKLVGDVKSYPRFIPWLKALRILEQKPLGDGGWEGVAEATVGWKAITERFSTRVRCSPEEGAVDVSLVKGPFKSLANRWRFEEAPEGAPKGALVKFWVAYEFKNPVLQRLLTFQRAHAAARVMRAFEDEAKRRLTPQSN
ncbi:MAG: type II toxin-antitoxin system RatA family toxin [Hyphomonadaceae bacterium]|nr:type II toxin-antitoxin system RatA family toxin [Hyphomonadaceae bacterium]